MRRKPRKATASGSLRPDRPPARCRVCLKPVRGSRGTYCGDPCKEFQNFLDAMGRAMDRMDLAQIPPERRAVIRGELVRAANRLRPATQHTARDGKGRFRKVGA